MEYVLSNGNCIWMVNEQKRTLQKVRGMQLILVFFLVASYVYRVFCFVRYWLCRVSHWMLQFEISTHCESANRQKHTWHGSTAEMWSSWAHKSYKKELCVCVCLYIFEEERKKSSQNIQTNHTHWIWMCNVVKVDVAWRKRRQWDIGRETTE